MFGSYTRPYYTDDLTDGYEATSGIDLTQRESHMQESRDNNKEVARKQKMDAGGSEKPEI